MNKICGHYVNIYFAFIVNYFFSFFLYILFTLYIIKYNILIINQLSRVHHNNFVHKLVYKCKLGYTAEKPKPSWVNIWDEFLESEIGSVLQFLDENFEPPVRKCK